MKQAKEQSLAFLCVQLLTGTVKLILGQRLRTCQNVFLFYFDDFHFLLLSRVRSSPTFTRTSRLSLSLASQFIKET
jgi:hypothetical protein